MISANQSKENHTLPEHIHGVTFAPLRPPNHDRRHARSKADTMPEVYRRLITELKGYKR